MHLFIRPIDAAIGRPAPLFCDATTICMHSNIMHALHSKMKGEGMAMLTVRNLPDDVHRALRVRAAQHGQSTEAEVREILAKAVKPEARVRMGDALAALGRSAGVSNADVEALGEVMSKPPAVPMRFK